MSHLQIGCQAIHDCRYGLRYTLPPSSWVAELAAHRFSFSLLSAFSFPLSSSFVLLFFPTFSSKRLNFSTQACQAAFANPCTCYVCPRWEEIPSGNDIIGGDNGDGGLGGWLGRLTLQSRQKSPFPEPATATNIPSVLEKKENWVSESPNYGHNPLYATYSHVSWIG